MRWCGLDSRRPNHLGPHARHAFTLVEVLVVGGVIAILIAILVPALSGGLQTASMAKSQTRLKSIATWMQDYSSTNREYIVPSQFDYTAAAATYAVQVRSDSDLPAGERYIGTWTDILWTFGGMGTRQALVDKSQPANIDKYVYDSPDRAAYEADEDYESPFRSTEENTHDFAAGNGVAIPFGPGATESGLPGYFAANDFFNANPNSPGNNGWFVTGQIKAPDRSVYLVDSVAGETIPDDATAPGPWDNPSIDPFAGAPAVDLHVDFRYNGACLMLFLDGHSQAEAPWRDLAELKGTRKIRVENLTQN